jgi:lysyl-tRNA synthetase class II
LADGAVFHERRFIEVETPMMHAIAGGATAVSELLLDPTRKY